MTRQFLKILFNVSKPQSKDILYFRLLNKSHQLNSRENFLSDYYHTIHKPKNKLLIVHAYKPVVNNGPWEDRAERVLGTMTHQEEKAKILREKYSRIVSCYNDLNVSFHFEFYFIKLNNYF